MPNKRTTTSSIAIAACRVELGRTAPTELRLVPAGHFKARDGRPKGILKGWYLDAIGAAKLIAAAKLQQDDFVIDYEHQTLYSETNGQPAPAAGWFKSSSLEWRPDGLYATGIKWTAAAKSAIESDEYRYFSPVIGYDPVTGAVTHLQMGALVNYAAIDGLNGLTARAAAKFSFSTSEDSTVDRNELIALYGLAADASDADIMAACKAAKDAASETAALKTEVAALKTKGTETDPAKFVPLEQMEALKTEMAALKNGVNAREVDELVASGLSTGKLLPAQKEWAHDLGKKDVAALKTYLEKTPAIEALKGTQTKGSAPAGEGMKALTDSQLAICKSTGIDPEDYKKQLAKEAV